MFSILDSNAAMTWVAAGLGLIALAVYLLRRSVQGS